MGRNFVRAKIKTSDQNKKPPFELALGDGVYYEHKETGVEIRLYHYSRKEGPSPEKVKVSGYDKHGNTYHLTLSELQERYTQKKQWDFTDPVDPRLPYVFDLYYDVKTVSALKQHIEYEGVDQTLRQLMIEHNISI